MLSLRAMSRCWIILQIENNNFLAQRHFFLVIK